MPIILNATVLALPTTYKQLKRHKEAFSGYRGSLTYTQSCTDFWVCLLAFFFILSALRMLPGFTRQHGCASKWATTNIFCSAVVLFHYEVEDMVSWNTRSCDGSSSKDDLRGFDNDFHLGPRISSIMPYSDTCLTCLAVIKQFTCMCSHPSMLSIAFFTFFFIFMNFQACPVYPHVLLSLRFPSIFFLPLPTLTNMLACRW